MNRYTRPFLALLALAALSGCANVSAVRVNGKVIAGAVSFIGAVPDNDPRLSGPGLQGVEVQIVSKNTTSAEQVVGTAKSDANGNFKAILSDQSAIKVPSEFKASGPGYLTAQNTLYIPASDKRLLVVLKKGPGSLAPSRPGLSQAPATDGRPQANLTE
jgi:hypothetical protein